VKSLAALLVVVLLWAAGLWAFASRIEASTPAGIPEAADGVVVLTGAGSNERILAGVRLLEAEKGKRMLVSGVYRAASREDIRAVSKATRRLYDCCVDLDFNAANTIGNAKETADWARAMRYDSLIVVTADYHMPRAMLELRSAMPKVRLQAYPVTTPVIDMADWWRSSKGARLIGWEYCKYLAILGREAVLSLGPREDPASRKD